MQNFDEQKYHKMVYDTKMPTYEIFKTIPKPQSLFKFRPIDNYWKESLSGVVYFPCPKGLNVNDSNDCAVTYKAKELKRKLFKPKSAKMSSRSNGLFTKMFNGEIEKITNELQGNVRIACFTDKTWEDVAMWKDNHFGNGFKGYCIEYEFLDALFCPFLPNTKDQYQILTMPVTYSTKRFSSTSILFNLMRLDENANNQGAERYICCTGFNHILVKEKKLYQKESEWRIIVPKNRLTSYFDFTKEGVDRWKVDFGSAIKAIYLGPDYMNSTNGEIEEFLRTAKEECRKRTIPLYSLEEIDGKLVKHSIDLS